jgi:cytochrome c oxidase cbb3-type subunit 3
MTPAYQRGAQVFADNCAACHGAQGEGMIEMGAPRLNDEIWLWGGDRASIRNTVTNAHVGVMPAWEGRLSPDAIKALAVYVHTLGGGQEEAPEADE